MWLEHLLFGAVNDASCRFECFKARFKVSCTSRVFLRYTGCPHREAVKFIDNTERDNEVKEEKRLESVEFEFFRVARTAIS